MGDPHNGQVTHYFNSLMVRLKYGRGRRRLANFPFQFLNGAIKISYDPDTTIHISNFNSLMVRLKSSWFRRKSPYTPYFNSLMVRLKWIASTPVQRNLGISIP